MKLNLLLNAPGDVRNGYINVDPFTPPNDTTRVQGNVTQLDGLVDGGEAREIVALDVLDYIPAKEVSKVVDHWVSKLGHGGTITIGATDLLEIAKAISARLITVETACKYLHGEQKEQWQIKFANYSVGVIAKMLQDRGLKILKKRLVEYQAVVVAQRP